MAGRQALDAVIVGAGLSGLYMLHRLLGQGMSARVYEAAPEVGGTWYLNRYPGARCDVESFDYSYSFDEDLQQEWSWSERYPAQPEMLRYLRHVADRFELRRHITFGARVRAAHYHDGCWTVRTERGEEAVGRFCIMATGCLSIPKEPDIPGLGEFAGEVHRTMDWPAHMDLSGQRVGVVGTGSSGVQVIPILAEQARHLTVFQRTPAFCVPANNGPLDPGTEREVKAAYAERRRHNRRSQVGFVRDDNPRAAFEVGERQRRDEYARRWEMGGFALLGAFADLLTDQRANDTAAEFIRAKIRDTVNNPDVAERLLPWGYPVGAKRLCVGTGYYETFNRDDVTLVDLAKAPLETVTAAGVRTREREHRLDTLVLATGFDAMTGALERIDIRGRDGLALADRWAHRPHSYLGLGVAGFPNLFIIAGPGSPSVLTNMVTAIEQHVEWTADCLAYLRGRGHRSIEPAIEAEDAWTAHLDEVAGQTLFPRAPSWYTGANVPGKPRVFMPYAGGLATYEETCQDVAAQGYRGFILT
ncbi:flavin-containing monooxygenase [Spirillospora sp. NPDC048911]|uniref:flavin-containing monooxygenase n=1 Tax=Spirillospora sp. NPDC048911 TaxID=3364527 RepID=UPI003713ABA2